MPWRNNGKIGRNLGISDGLFGKSPQSRSVINGVTFPMPTQRQFPQHPRIRFRHLDSTLFRNIQQLNPIFTLQKPFIYKPLIRYCIPEFTMIDPCITIRKGNNNEQLLTWRESSSTINTISTITGPGTATTIDLSSFRWQRHCHGLFELHVAT